MPIALLFALAASLGIHAAALFGPDLEIAAEPEPMPLIAELRPLPPPMALPPPQAQSEQKPAPARPAKVRKAPRAAPPKPPVELAAAPAALAESAEVASPGPASTAADPLAESPPAAEAPAEVAAAVEPAPLPEPTPAASESRLPPRGKIHYRVDRGDSNFEIGVSEQEWQIADGRYHLRSVIETTGIVHLFKAYRIEMESRGAIGEHGPRPDDFVIRRNGVVRERASFDWQAMTIKVGDKPAQPLAPGAQDLLSFNYALGFLRHGEEANTLPITTGKKYGVYRLEVVGDEEIEVPAGVLRTLHLRAPGVNTTELWLAYDYLLLPVKIRHVDHKGDSLVQVATAIHLDYD